MKRFQLVLLLLAFTTLTAKATNVVNAIGLSPASVAMGGTGTANFTNGMDAIYKNPALLGYTGQTTVDLAINLVKPNGTGNFGTGEVQNSTTLQFVPDLTGTYRHGDWVFGFGVLPYSGAISDYTTSVPISQPKLSLSLMRFAPAVSWNHDIWSFGISPTVTWGKFALNTGTGGVQSTRDPSSALGFGGQVGVSVRPATGFTAGASYTMQTKMRYKQLIDLDSFGAAPNPGLDDINVNQPDEISVGVAYSPTASWNFTFDWRNIGWSRASGYDDFGFQTQNVFAVGAQYTMQAWVFRAGFNYAAAPLLDDATDAVGSKNIQGHSLLNQSVSDLDVFAFPAITTTHITVGTGYRFSEKLNVDFAAYYCPKVTLNRSGTGFGGAYAFTTSMSQWALNVGATYAF